MASFLVVISVLLCCTSGNPVHSNYERTEDSYFSPKESVISPVMNIKLRMEGEVNGHKFTVEGEGEGKPFEGTQTIDLEVTEGGPLPFAFDILTTAFQYGNRAFTKYPADIPDYFKESFPEGHSWVRTMVFDDGGVCDVTNDIRMYGNVFEYEITFHCNNFDPSGPIMQKETLKWEPSCEGMYAGKNGVLQGDDFRHLLLVGGSHFRCDFRTTYSAKKRVEMPEYHFIDHRIEILSHDKDYLKVTVYEIAEAKYSPLKSKAE